MTHERTTHPDHRWTAEEVRALGLHTSVSTAAEILGISRSTAYDLIRRDEFPVRVLRLGTRVRVPVRPLLTLLGFGGALERDRP